MEDLSAASLEDVERPEMREWVEQAARVPGWQ